MRAILAAACVGAALGAAAPAAAESPVRLTLVLHTGAAPAPLHLLDRSLALHGPDGAALAGGGDAATVIAPVLAFILGVFPGFGIGHLVSGSFGGFFRWLITDLLVALFYGLGEALLWGPGGWYVVRGFAIAAVVALRIWEGFSAMRAAERAYASADALLDPRRRFADADAGTLRPAVVPVPRLTAIRF